MIITEFVLGCVQLIIVQLLITLVWKKPAGTPGAANPPGGTNFQPGVYPPPSSGGVGGDAKTNLNTNPLFLAGGGQQPGPPPIAAGIGGDVFGAGGGAIPGQPPTSSEPNPNPLAGTNDPNYQTLAGIGGEVFGAGGGGGAQPPPPVAGTNDPNYQTLAGIGGDVFNDKKPENRAPVAGTHDPNYQTLAGVAGDVFNK